jgi:hypothetical protein
MAILWQIYSLIECCSSKTNLCSLSQVAHEVQLLNYLTATGLDEELLLNFSAAQLEFKKKFRQPGPLSGS